MYHKLILQRSVKLLAFLLALFPAFAQASETVGTIDTTNRYAWGENIGWVDFGSSEGNVQITDTELTGYAYSETTGWISLNCSNDNSCGSVDFRVSNDGEGTLSGYGWSENTGWVIFSCGTTGTCASSTYGVTINEDGIFQGQAWSETLGWILFNCAVDSSCASVYYYVETDWRPTSARSSQEESTSSSSGGGIFLSLSSPVGMEGPFSVIINNGLSKTADNQVLLELNASPDTVYMAVSRDPNFHHVSVQPYISSIIWDLCDKQCLPGEQSVYVRFYDSNGNRSVIVQDTITYVDSPQSSLRIPVPVFEASTPSSTVLVAGETVSSSDIVVNGEHVTRSSSLPYPLIRLFSKSANIDAVFPVNGEYVGNNQPAFQFLPNTSLELQVFSPYAPSHLAGSLTLKELSSDQTQISKPQTRLRRFFLGEKVHAQTNEEISDKVIVQYLSYTDEDNDGVYVDSLYIPPTNGTYEITTSIQTTTSSPFQDVGITQLVSKYGHVLEKKGDRVLPIHQATVALFWINPDTKQYELWPAENFNQQNPQITNTSGEYVFMVPEGSYYISVNAESYLDYIGPVFYVRGQSRSVEKDIILTERFHSIYFFSKKHVILMIMGGILFLSSVYWYRKARKRYLMMHNT